MEHMEQIILSNFDAPCSIFAPCVLHVLLGACSIQYQRFLNNFTVNLKCSMGAPCSQSAPRPKNGAMEQKWSIFDLLHHGAKMDHVYSPVRDLTIAECKNSIVAPLIEKCKKINFLLKFPNFVKRNKVLLILFLFGLGQFLKRLDIFVG